MTIVDPVTFVQFCVAASNWGRAPPGTTAGALAGLNIMVTGIPESGSNHRRAMMG